MFEISTDSSVAPFQQLRTQIIAAITSGELPSGERLPPVRTLAAQLDIAPGTVARAFKELEAAGFLETRGRNGTFVSAQGDPAAIEAQHAAADFAARVRAAGVPASDALEYARRALHADSGS